MSEIVAASEAAALGGMAGVEPAFTALNTLIILLSSQYGKKNFRAP